MYLLIVLLPLISSISLLIFGRFIGKEGAILISNILMGIELLISFFLFYEVAFCSSFCFFYIFNWFNINICFVNWGFYFDTLTVVMLLIIIFISLLVHVYSIDYMQDDPHIIRFMSYLSLFTFFMIILVTSDNLIQLFVGWEGVGLCSYLLINFWHTRIQANKAAMKAVFINRIGDLGIIIAILILYYTFLTINFSVIFAIGPVFLISFKFYCFAPYGCKLVYLFHDLKFLGFSISFLDLTAFFLLFGAIGKSAQIGLHTWLPDAMEGPTPVSALIHAATMVTAGVFLIVRFSPFFEMTSNILFLVSIIGALTALFGATTALFQNDIKKIIAYSTCSQLGYMFLICGLSHYSVGIFHLFNHAFFKALLFLCSGAIIHALNDEQDCRRMGGLRKILPFIYSSMLIGSFSLIGFPFLTGFYSKDLILEILFSSYTNLGFFLYVIGVLSAIFTALYSIKLIFLVFFSRPNFYYSVGKNIHEVSNNIFYVLTVLTFFSIFIGFFFKDMFVGLGTPFWGNSIFIFNENSFFCDSEFLFWKIKLIPLGFIFISLICSYYFCLYYNLKIFKFKIKFKNIYIFFNKKWFFDKIQNELVSQNFLNIFLNNFYFQLDKGFLEVFGPHTIVNKLNLISLFFRRMHKISSFNNYFLIIFSGVLFFFFYYFNFLIIIFLIIFIFLKNLDYLK